MLKKGFVTTVPCPLDRAQWLGANGNKTPKIFQERSNPRQPVMDPKCLLPNKKCLSCCVGPEVIWWSCRNPSPPRHAHCGGWAINAQMVPIPMLGMQILCLCFGVCMCRGKSSCSAASSASASGFHGSLEIFNGWSGCCTQEMQVGAVGAVGESAVGRVWPVDVSLSEELVKEAPLQLSQVQKRSGNDREVSLL